MRYALLICGDENAEQTIDADEAAGVMAEYARYSEDLGRRGILLDGARLRPTSDATTVQVRNGQVLTADGPFAETKEQIGGYYVVECQNLDEAIELAARIPGARTGTVEVRPVWDM